MLRYHAEKLFISSFMDCAPSLFGSPACRPAWTLASLQRFTVPARSRRVVFIYKEQCMSEMMNESGAPAIEWSYGGRGDDIISSLSLDTVEEQPQGFLMTVDRPVQIFKDALSPMMAFVTLLRPLYARTGEGFQYVPVSNPWTDVQRLPASAGYLGVQVNAGLFFHGAKPTHYKDRDGQMKPIDGGTLLQNITVLHQVAQPLGPGEGAV